LFLSDIVSTESHFITKTRQIYYSLTEKMESTSLKEKHK